jgi:Heavy metal binding domain
MGVYVCPMHQDLRFGEPGKCPKCGMALVAEDARFPLLRHMASNPLMLAVMFAGMLALMVAAMMLMR